MVDNKVKEKYQYLRERLAKWETTRVHTVSLERRVSNYMPMGAEEMPTEEDNG